MSILLFASPKILLQTSAEDWLSVVGENSILFTDKNACSAIQAHVGNIFSKIEYFTSFTDNDLVELRALELHAEQAFKNVVALAEIDVLRTARIRKALNLSAPYEEDISYFRDKHEMKVLSRKHGIPVAEFKLVNNAIELIQFIKEQDYPVVVKPIDGRGSAGVEILRDRDQLSAYLSSGDLALFGPRLAEKFIPGDMYQANGLYVDGKCVLISIVKCVNSCLDFLQGEFLGLCMLSDANPLKARLIDFTKNLLDHALPMPKDGLFHVELFYTPNDEIYLCEAACRLGGCIVNDEIRESYGIDIRLEYIKTQTMLDYCSPLTNNVRYSGRLLGQLNIPPEIAVLGHKPKDCPFEWVEFYRHNGTVGEKYDKMAFTNGEVASFLISGETEAEIEERFYIVSDWFKKISNWVVN